MTAPAILCRICSKSQSPKYKCPRCGIDYCSSACYNNPKHGNCSETFYKENVLEEMKNVKTSDEAKRKALEMLQSYMDDGGDEDEDDEDGDDIVNRFDDIDLDNASTEDILALLKDKDLKDFEKYVESKDWHSDVASLIDPWWLAQSPILLPFDTFSTSKKSLPRPQPCAAIPSLSILTSRAPNPSLIFSTADLLFTYAIIYRHLDGVVTCQKGEADECGAQLFCFFAWNVSRTLAWESFAYTDMVEALEASLARVRQMKTNELLGTETYILFQDVAALLSTKNTLLSALSDMHHAFQSLSQSIHDISKDERKKAAMTAKKIWFFLSLVNEYDEEALGLFKASVVAAAEGLKKEMGGYGGRLWRWLRRLWVD
ncbi:hypothetical protein BC829DRAFT_13652 [Chytridium lagenaria]|nr:hypothetical protein BC829DRAFT_13652 [Chytridium lagenaria]